MASPFLGEIRIISFNFPPKGWAFCNGQLLPINQNQALFALLGTTYGGNGTTNFALPNLQARAPVHMGNGIVLGERGGESAHTLAISELPAHTHQATASDQAADAGSPAGAYWAPGQANAYAPPNNNLVAMEPAAIPNAGGSQPHENMSPYLVLNFMIALQGIFPSQN